MWYYDTEAGEYVRGEPVEPDVIAQTRINEAKSRYVGGDISLRQLERRVDSILSKR
jgi:hypothetical protein